MLSNPCETYVEVPNQQSKQKSTFHAHPGIKRGDTPHTPTTRVSLLVCFTFGGVFGLFESPVYQKLFQLKLVVPKLQFAV